MEKPETTYLSDFSESDSDSKSERRPFFDFVSDDDLRDMETQAKEYIAEYVDENRVRFASPTFVATLVQEIAGVLLEEWRLIDVCVDEDYDDITDLVEQIYSENAVSPPRQEATTDDCSYINVGNILAKLRDIPQAKQRSPEWYETRHQLLTASNLWKVFGTPAQYNSLIYEKCLPISFDRKQMGTSMDSTNPMQMGIKYEPLSILLYEHRYGTRVSEVGCIPHAQYPYIGASPDGINMTPGFPRYGRMIEVKNIVNREITGVPLEHYWIQMQLQMEACDLDECDFIETRFKELDETNTTAYDVVKSDTTEFETTEQPMGCILYFLPRVSIIQTYTTETNSDVSDTKAEYVYMPLDIPVYSVAESEWINTQRATRPNQVLYKQTYWILDQFSCVLVRRNREWFRVALPRITEAWNTIVKERETGYDHRGSIKKKRPQTEVVCSDNTTTHYIKNMPFSSNICLVKLDAE